MPAAILEAERRTPQVTLPDAVGLQAILAQGLALAESANATARVLALDTLGDIDLPDTTPASADDQAQLRAIAPLYLAAQLEETLLLESVEMLTRLAMKGTVQADLGSAATLIEDFWQQRNERFHLKERVDLFTRLFGPVMDNVADSARQYSGGNEAFENLMIDLGESLYKLGENAIGETYGSPHAQNRLVVAARNLAENLLNKGGGMTAFAAQEILSTIQAGVRILQQPAVQHAFGARSLWSTVRVIAGRYLQSKGNTSAYVTRGKSGLVLLSWLADALPHLNQMPLATLEHPVIDAAAEWLQASLAIRETGAQTGG